MMSQTFACTQSPTLRRHSSGLYNFVHVGRTTYLSKFSQFTRRKALNAYIVDGTIAAKEIKTLHLIFFGVTGLAEMELAVWHCEECLKY